MINFLRNKLGAAKPEREQTARLPAGQRVYAIGDIHGRIDALDALDAAIEADLDARPIERPIFVHLGDYVDRGTRSREVLDRLIWKKANLEAYFLRGNHEATMLSFLDDASVIDDWRRYGGLETLHSYGIDVRDLMRGEGAEAAHESFLEVFPAAHLDFLTSLESMLVLGGYCFVHAGLKPGVPLERQTDESRLWIREEFLQFRGDFGKVVVHGHTPVEQPQAFANRINVDTGVYMTGRLSAAVLEGDSVRFLSSI